MGLGALGVIWWADDAHGSALARTMGLTTFALGNLFFSFATKDERQSVFSLDTFADRKFVIASALSLAAIVAGAEVGIVHRLLDTVDLSSEQWLVCIAVSLLIVVVSEARKLLLRRRPDAVPAVDAASPDAPAGVVAA